MGGDLPSFALLSSPSREYFISLSYLTQTNVLSGPEIKDWSVQGVRMIGVIDDGLCWMITSHPIIRGINLETCFNYHYTSSNRDGRSTRRAPEAAHI